MSTPSDALPARLYCTFCGAGEREASECEDVRCNMVPAAVAEPQDDLHPRLGTRLHEGSAAMTTLADLIGRVERATGPDREIDAAIFEISGLVNESHCTMWCSQDGRTDLTRERYIRAWAPDFTRSIDAALHLVPENTEITITSLMWRPGRAVANLRTGSVIDPATREWSSTAATMPLALVAASLKARSA